MCEDAADLVPGTDLQEAFGDGDGGVVRVAARGEGVGLRFGGDVQLRKRHVGLGGQVAYDGEVLGVAGFVGGDARAARMARLSLFQ